MKKTKILAMYLPQYHEIPENNKFWGKGFTDWTTVKAAEKFYKFASQPKIPLNNNYYDLSKIDNIRWQADLARKYGIDGFCFYHYWFSSDKCLLQKPAELFLSDKSINLNFCFCWDNTSWKRTWSGQDGNAWAPIIDKQFSKKDRKNQKEMLIQFDYEGEEGWKKHFEYLLPFFQDTRYIKIDNKPVFVMYSYNGWETLEKMCNYWNMLAKEYGFDGIHFVGKYSDRIPYKFMDSEYLYQPHFAAWERPGFVRWAFDRAISSKIINKYRPVTYNYKTVWKRVIKQAKLLQKQNVFYGAFINYDDTPRRGKNGKLLSHKKMNVFKKYFSQLYRISCGENKDVLFFTAWNEWGEGAYLEPDTEIKYQSLECIKEIVDNYPFKN